MLDFSYWEGRSPGFLDYDAASPVRDFAARIVEEARPVSLLEVGFGGAGDYARRWRYLGCPYTGVDGCLRFVESARASHPEATWLHGTFDGLGVYGWDVAYTMATLEHQPELKPALPRLLAATQRLAVVVWYRAPAAEEKREYQESERVHYNTWRREDVDRIAAESGFAVESHQMAPHCVDVFRAKA